MSNLILRRDVVRSITGFVLLSAVSRAQADPSEEAVLFDFGKQAYPSPSIKTQGAGVSVVRHNDRLEIRVPAGQSAALDLLPAAGRWDISAFTRLQFGLANPGARPLRLTVRADNRDATDWSNGVLSDGFVRPRTRKSHNLYLNRPYAARDRYPELKQFQKMNGLPGGLQSHWHTIDAADVRVISIHVHASDHPQTLELSSVRATHPVVPALLKADMKGFFPFSDRYGQYRWADWPGKVKHEADLKRIAVDEAADLTKNPGGKTWDRWGGWANGPVLKATGAFRTEKVDSRWWLVDPDGRLFWSHGADSVSYDSADTPVLGREGYFEDLPDRRGEMAFAWSTVQKTGDSLTFNILKANLYRQHGSDWESVSRDLTHRRLRSWGMNTMGNWSDYRISKMRRTPYTIAVHPWSPIIFDNVWDVFRPEFAGNFDRGIARAVQESADDPWCIGYFVDNELAWSNPVNFMGRVLSAGPENHTKQRFVAFLKEKSGGAISVFNQRAKTAFADWEALQKNTGTVDLTVLKAEAEEFYGRIGEQYFSVVKTAVKKHAPNRLYLGCRMHVLNPIIVQAAGRHCDVLSFNLYREDVREFQPPGAVDAPCLVSEFHFGALDRGSLATGLAQASDQEDRADKYHAYVSGALQNPWMVGTHWFAYCPQAITGRGDGENYQDGLFDVTNNPYPELRSALRDVGYRLYDIRSGSPTSTAAKR